ncbi:MAG: sigma-54 dependent transcriptional regulator [Bacteroidetes bacterium]|nr:sigma-54 dependent transcriptional regulator [Bacteroidota bacterium]
MKEKKHVLIVDDEAPMRLNIAELMTGEGYNYSEAAGGDEAILMVQKIIPDLVLLDINLPQKDGLTVLGEIQKLFPKLPVIVFTAYGTSERAIEAIKLGAFDYIEKPFELDEFLLTIKRALEYSELLNEIKLLRDQVQDISSTVTSDQIIGRSPQMQEIFKLIGKVALSDTTVLIQGGSGTGKELIADAIQRHSLRRDKPYIKVNCGALSESILESEIFGHEKGSFTGATSQRMGRFELADGGTIFLDEINNMPLSLQVKLLRILQKQPFYRVGGETPIKVDVRIITASNRIVEDDVKAGKLREDLFYRLNVVRINLPPLVDRKQDIPYLVDYFLKKHSNGRSLTVSPEMLERLSKYEWPGNIRELENTIQRAAVISQSDVLTIDHLPVKHSVPSSGQTYSGSDLQSWFEEIQNADKSLKDVVCFVEKELILQALKQTNSNRSRAATLLKIHRRLLYTKMKEYGISTD